MRGKKITAMVLTIMMAFAMLPVQVLATEPVYTVTVKAGEGSGDDIVLRSDEETIAEDFHGAGNLQFYRCGEGKMGFHLNDDYCPPSFTAPEGYFFDGWTVNNGGNLQFIDDISENTTFIAKWREDTTPKLGPIDGIPKTFSGEDFYLNGIKWHVIGEDESRWLAVSYGLLGDPMTWSDAMDYCGTVHNGFSDAEKAALRKITKTDEKYYYNRCEYDGVGDDYDDPGQASHLNEASVFLLSMAEANWYFADDNTRICPERDSWWLRSRFHDSDRTAGTVATRGSLVPQPVYLAFGCRPAFVLDRPSVLFRSAAGGGKSSEPSDGSSFGSFNDGGTGAKKLTLKDEAHKSFTANVKGSDSVTVKPGGQLTVSCKNAVTGDNEYVSAMLCDATEASVGYASMKPSSASEEWELTLPAGLTDGATYTLKVFNEQQNGADASGNALTDYASPFSVITLSVNVNAKNDQTITASDFTKTYGDKPFAIEATTDGDGTFSYSSDMPSVADVDRNGTVTIKGVGEANITITASETENFNSATKTIKVTVNAAPVTIYKVTVQTDGNGTASASPASGAAGTSVTITAKPNAGYDFDEWKVISGGVTLKDPKNAATTFKIGSSDVKVKAVFARKSAPVPAPSKISIRNAKIVFSPDTLTYNKKTQKVSVKSVTVNGKTLRSGTDYTVSWSPATIKKAGDYSVTIKGKGSYTDKKTVTYKVKQAKNPLTVKLEKSTVKIPFKKLKKAKQTVKRSKYLTVSKKQGKVTYKKTDGDEKITIDKNTGDIIVRKGLKKGKYSVSVKITAAGDNNYKAASKTKSFTVKVTE